MKRVGGGYQFDTEETMLLRGVEGVYVERNFYTEFYQLKGTSVYDTQMEKCKTAIHREMSEKYALCPDDIEIVVDHTFDAMSGENRFRVRGVCPISFVVEELSNLDFMLKYKIKCDPEYRFCSNVKLEYPPRSMHIPNYLIVRNSMDHLFSEYPTSNDMLPKEVIYNGPATICKWKDGTKTVSMKKPGEPDDPLYGFLMCFFRKHCGMDNNGMKHWLNKRTGTKFSVAKKRRGKNNG